jgi:hypothetical protein
MPSRRAVIMGALAASASFRPPAQAQNTPAGVPGSNAAHVAQEFIAGETLHGVAHVMASRASRSTAMAWKRSVATPRRASAIFRRTARSIRK